MAARQMPTFAREAPTGLVPPAWLLSAASGSSRSEYIGEHGFTEKQIGSAWWAERGVALQLSPGADEVLRLTRGDLFLMAGRVSDDEGSLLTFLWHVLAWGSGTSRRNNDRRILSARTQSLLLREAFSAARAGDPRAAYRTLIRKGGAVIPHLGPAFFSKFLYFASEGAPSRSLILDARVARSLYELGWSIAPTYPRRTFSYNWCTDTYVSYCELLAKWAAEAGDGVGPDMFERALFEGPPASNS
jgi:hypothetical protein